jgi:serine/threonine-protein kinase
VALVAAAAAAAIVAGSLLVVAGRDGDGVTPTPATSGSAGASPTVLVPAAIPTILGLTEDQARTLLEGAGLAVGTVTEVPGAEGVVVDSDPTQGEAVTAGTTVDLFVGDGTAG